MKIYQILLFVSFLIGCCVYLTIRLWQIFPFNQSGKIIFISAIIFLFLAFFLSFLLGNKLPVGITTFLYRVGSSWFMICVYLLMIFLLIDIVRITHLVNIDKYVFNNIYFFISLCSALTIIMSIGYYNYQNKTREEITLSSSKINENKQLKIVAISDLHLGYGIGNKELNRWIKLINKEEADVILICGDLIDNSIKPVRENNMNETLKKFHSKYGVYAILGNHEFISGSNESIRFIEDSDIILLKDSSVLINGLYIVGRDDATNKSRKSLKEILASIDNSKPIILMDHQPSNLDEAMKNNIDLQLSGHTHRGQIWPISWITDKIFEVSHGFYQKDKTNYYVTSGIGIWAGKFRLGSKSEYVVINFNY
ncbi:metallophosphoesterase [Bacteroidales bacterium OttesenSCG-928-K03]|nr:metallophosphoesterase [Odoribacter sp. OttesenSCG-928-L07]MDL2238797.1 metallophosphoesterase [Bacteroidales bacterium OttesenSCG-928-L14]MDL2240786.1 metallophosphoesterase [Bacteroidales bacterium OttesenSCG-928-K22]MDL2242176.1 metallophosphoesterase [Bacteroidales bacterium OttesenSCG-928-K03]